MTKMYILGAGFSRAFCNNAPLLDGYFTNIASSDLRNKIDEYRASGINSNEYISSLLLDLAYEFDYKERLKKRTLIFEFLREVASKVENIVPDDIDGFKRFLRKYFHSPDEKKIIITFNYDTLIEDYCYEPYYAVGLNSNPYNYGPVIIDGGDIGAETVGVTICLLKLHGSINWFKYSEEDKADIENVFVCHKSDATYQNIKGHNAPVFVPFSFNKSSYLEGNLFSLIWQRFIFFLEACSDIEIIGYSFPESDYQVASKIASFREKISKVTVKETDEKKIKNLQTLFGDKVVLKDVKDEYPC